MNVVLKFFTSCDFPRGCNSSFIALIPKVHDPKFVHEFRHISLIGCQYKTVGKILANRLALLLDGIVSMEQLTFIKGRQILDDPLIINELVAWCEARHKKALIFKVDFEKAYDFVRRDFLDDIFDRMGFGFKWRSWIQSCLCSARGSVLVNGSLTNEFQFYRGLRQGDPLSPFLL